MKKRKFHGRFANLASFTVGPEMLLGGTAPVVGTDVPGKAASVIRGLRTLTSAVDLSLIEAQSKPSMTVDSDLLPHDVRQLDKQPSAVLDTAVPSVHTIDRHIDVGHIVGSVRLALKDADLPNVAGHPQVDLDLIPGIIVGGLPTFVDFAVVNQVNGVAVVAGCSRNDIPLKTRGRRTTSVIINRRLLVHCNRDISLS